ncbi:integrase [Marinobacterium sp. MBR-111]|jgi:integrase|uniref:tyrosine-type recombinase/integrase n=1 Tax=Marinobacterium sp. MBR-111 TaxID=3156463 RepID=UPI003397DA3E
MEKSHKASHNTSHIGLPPVAHTIQRNGVYHYKKRVHSTIVQCSLRTADPALARYLVTVLDREVMDAERDREEIVKKVKRAVKKRPRAGAGAAYSFVTNNFEVLIKPPSRPKSLITIDENGNPVFDYGGDVKKEIEALMAYRELMSCGGGGGGPVDSGNLTIIEHIEKYLDSLVLTKEVTAETLVNYKRMLMRWHDFMCVKYLHEIDYDKHLDYVLTLRKKTELVASSINNEVAQVNAFVDYLKARKLVDLPKLKALGSKIVNSEKQERWPFEQKHMPAICEALTMMDYQARIVVVLCFMTGARVGEIGQLETKDVIKHEGILYIDINNEDEDPTESEEFKAKRKKVKTENSKRRVPVPTCLVPIITDLHKQALKKQGSALFFGINEPKSKKANRGTTASRAFIYQLRNNHGFGPEYVTHSARHMFRGLCDYKELHEPTVEKVMGHASQKTGRSVYSKTELSMELKSMLEVVDFIANKYCLTLVNVLTVPKKRKKYTRKTNTKSDQ